MKIVKGEKLYQSILIITSLFFALLCLYPLLYIIFVSLVSESEWLRRDGLLLFFPSNPTISAYQRIFVSGSNIYQALGVSVFRTVVGTFFGVVMTIFLGYAVSRKEMPGRGPLMALIMFTILFSSGLIPSYLTMKELKLVNTMWALIVPALVSTFNVLVFKQFFEGIPAEIQESAELDGVGEFRLLFRIFLPMSQPVIASIAMFTVVGHWNSWFDAKVFIDQTHSHLWPLQLYTMINFNNLGQTMQADKILSIISGQGATALSTKMAYTVVSIIPILVLYPFFQKYFSKGVYTGAVKG